MSDLVTIGVITYNSGATVLDTLNSIKAINYSPIQLIISDDCSTDDTIPKCQEWFHENKQMFEAPYIITVEKNSGTSANCNRILALAKGKWFKIIAGDDILFPNSISVLMDYANHYPYVEWIVSKHHTYNNSFEGKNYLEKEDEQFSDKWKAIFEYDVNEQYNVMLKRNFIITPTSIFNTRTLKNSGGYNEKYGILEDYPLYLKLLSLGVKAFLCDEFTMGYRRGDNNVCASNIKLFNLRHVRARFLVQQDLCFSEYSFNRRMYERFNYYKCCIIDYLHLNNAKSLFARFVDRCIHIFIKIIFFSKSYDF